MASNCSGVLSEKGEKMFRTLKGVEKGVGPMTAVGLEKMIRKFEKTGSFGVQPGRGRKRIDSTLVEAVDTAMQEQTSGGVQTCSARRTARTLDISASTSFVFRAASSSTSVYSIARMSRDFVKKISHTIIICFHFHSRSELIFLRFL
ncbi:uncharacterized protein LOC126237248 isoform X2 [Schistocerca nitens]|uniref:uncharacterized protein LOC126237248 isoform X2 n=1 Tax=Schistocerca nitens TaxID=7011 RepID=UPI002117A50E|nr:uncharacterized protein LOC126237248 isoform X2 [Schistocerca nitens]